MIKRLTLFSLLVVVFTSTILASHVALANNPSEFRKQTGGGLFTDWETGNKVTFSFTAQALEPTPENNGFLDAKGKFQLIDHTEKTRIHGTIDYLWYYAPEPWWSSWEGECSVDGKDDYYFLLSLHDEDEPGWAGEWAWILIYEDVHHQILYREYWLDGKQGNIKAH